MSNFPHHSVSGLFGDSIFKDQNSLMPILDIAFNELVNDLHGKNSRFVQRLRDNKGFPKVLLTTKYNFDKDNTDEPFAKYVVLASVPGYSEEDITIQTEQDSKYTYLVIKGDTPSFYQDLDLERPFYNEIFRGNFFRKIPLPENINEDSIEASLKDGMLSVSWEIIDPEKYQEENVKKIQINKS